MVQLRDRDNAVAHTVPSFAAPVGISDAVRRQFPTDAFPHLAELTVQHVPRPGYNCDYADDSHSASS